MTSDKYNDLARAFDLMQIKYNLTVSEYHALKKDYNELGKWTQEIREALRNKKLNHGSYKVEEND